VPSSISPDVQQTAMFEQYYRRLLSLPPLSQAQNTQRLLTLFYDNASKDLSDPQVAQAFCNDAIARAMASQFPTTDEFIRICQDSQERRKNLQDLYDSNSNMANIVLAPLGLAVKQQTDKLGPWGDTAYNFLAEKSKDFLLGQMDGAVWDSPLRIGNGLYDSLTDQLNAGLVMLANNYPAFGAVFNGAGTQDVVGTKIPQTTDEAAQTLSPKSQSVLSSCYGADGAPVVSVNPGILLNENLVAIFADDLQKFKDQYDQNAAEPDEATKAQKYADQAKEVEYQQKERGAALSLLRYAFAGNPDLEKVIGVAAEVNSAVNAIQSFLLPNATMGPFGLANALAGAVSGIIGLFGGGGNDGFQQISKQIANLQKAMVEGFRQIEQTQLMILKALNLLTLLIEGDEEQAMSEFSAINDQLSAIITINLQDAFAQAHAQLDKCADNLNSVLTVIENTPGVPNPADVDRYGSYIDEVYSYANSATSEPTLAGPIGNIGAFVESHLNANPLEATINSISTVIAATSPGTSLQSQIANPCEFDAACALFVASRLAFPAGQITASDKNHIVQLIATAKKASDCIKTATEKEHIQNAVTKYLAGVDETGNGFPTQAAFRAFFASNNDPSGSVNLKDIFFDYTPGTVSNAVSQRVMPDDDGGKPGAVKEFPGLFYLIDQTKNPRPDGHTYTQAKVDNDPISFCIDNNLIECPESSAPAVALTGLGRRLLDSLAARLGYKTSDILGRVQQLGCTLGAFTRSVPGGGTQTMRVVFSAALPSNQEKLERLGALLELCQTLKAAYWSDCRERLCAQVMGSNPSKDFSTSLTQNFACISYLYLLRRTRMSELSAKREVWQDLQIPHIPMLLANELLRASRLADISYLTAHYGSPSGDADTSASLTTQQPLSATPFPEIASAGKVSFLSKALDAVKQDLQSRCNDLVQKSEPPADAPGHPCLDRAVAALASYAQMANINLGSG
jgi:hypothetical protein